MVWAVAAGYVALMVMNALVFTVAYLAVGIETAFKRDSFEISAVMALCGIAAGLLAGAAGGRMCWRLSGNRQALRALIPVASVATLASGVPMLARDRPTEGRPANIGRFDAMTRHFTRAGSRSCSRSFRPRVSGRSQDADRRRRRTHVNWFGITGGAH